MEKEEQEQRVNKVEVSSHTKKSQKESWDKKLRPQLDFRGEKRHKKSE